ncbi:glycosyltransferase family 2 protein [Sulfuriflexus mobilis]|uniref:glycosyltransferase family 2 protein n=1 Tax=Sulfuriflexus mobilis TaxID=1811807 RepID=UPI000F8244BE|nr:glycosyltransferase family 2 protein [Sulfuriflexus mobilis]
MTEILQAQAKSNKPPLLTVAMPVYNAGKYLRLAVLSIVKQTFTDWEFLIIDDGSTDNALRSIADIDDSRIQIIRDGENKGLAARLNEAIDLASGQYFARMDQDDVSYPERFEHQLRVLHNDSRLDLVAVRAISISDEDEPVGVFPYAATHEEICARPWRGFYLPHPTWMGKTSWFCKYRYTIPGPYYSEDMDLLLRSYKASQFCILPEILFAYRVRKNIVMRNQIKARLAVFGIQFRSFRRDGQWHYIIFATLVLLARVLSDCWRLCKQMLHIPSRQFTGIPVSAQIEWTEIRKRLS